MKRSLRYLVLALVTLACFQSRAWAAPVLGLTNETFIQLLAAPNASASPTANFTASASMSYQGCGNLSGPGPAFTGNWINLNEIPTHLIYFQNKGVVAGVQLNGACTITDSSSSQAQTFQFAIQVYFAASANSNGLPITASATPIGPICAGFTPTPAVAATQNVKMAATKYENLSVYPMPNPNNLPAQALPAVAVDIQEFYNGFTLDNFNSGQGGAAPFLIRVLCTPFSELQD